MMEDSTPCPGAAGFSARPYQVIVSSTPSVICQELLKVLARIEAEQPLICGRICICFQFLRYAHYILPRWDWGINKIICLGAGSLRNVVEKGGPFSGTTYREAIRNTDTAAQFNARPLDRRDALQAMLRHSAAIEMASGIKFLSDQRGVAHGLIKDHFTKLSLIKDVESPNDVGEEITKKLAKLPPTAGYAGAADLIDVPVYFADDEYTAEDVEALEKLAEIIKLAHCPPVGVMDVETAHGSVDEHTLVYAITSTSEVCNRVLQIRPAAIICSPTGCSLDEYDEFPLDCKKAPHTVGPAHMYIRKDVTEDMASKMIVPPYPVVFPPDHPAEPSNWYVNKLKKNC